MDSTSKERYEEKIKIIDGNGPYEVCDWEDNVELWPAVMHVHACMYLVLTSSPYTANDMMNYKSLDSYQSFVKGWVRCVLVKQYGEKIVVIGKVNHSQRMNEKPLSPWFIALKEGKILAGYCDCMAGFGETCSHLASLLWVVASGVQCRDSLTVTDKSACWVMPAGVAKVPFAEIRDISFAGKKKKKKM